MKTIVELDIEDIKKIIAEKFGVKPNDIELNNGTHTVGYGLAEHEEPYLKVKVVLDGEMKQKETDYWYNR